MLLGGSRLNSQRNAGEVACIIRKCLLLCLPQISFLPPLSPPKPPVALRLMRGHHHTHRSGPSHSRRAIRGHAPGAVRLEVQLVARDDVLILVTARVHVQGLKSGLQGLKSGRAFLGRTHPHCLILFGVPVPPII